MCKFSSNNLKTTSSILTMGIFVVFGFASIVEGDPEVKDVDCTFFHTAYNVTQKVKITVDKSGTVSPIIYLAGVVISFTISEYEKADDNGLCNLVLKNSYNKKLTTNSSGEVSFTLNKTYVSNDDLIDIYLYASLPGYFGNSFQFQIMKSDPERNYFLDLLENKQYP